MILEILHFETLEYRNKIRELVEYFLKELKALEIKLNTKRTSIKNSKMPEIISSLEDEVSELSIQRDFIVKYLSSIKDFLKSHNLDDILRFIEEKEEINGQDTDK